MRKWNKVAGSRPFVYARRGHPQGREVWAAALIQNILSLKVSPRISGVQIYYPADLSLLLSLPPKKEDSI